MRDDRNALHRRTVKARFNGIYATFVGFKMVHLPKWMYIYAIKNAVVEIIKIIYSRQTVYTLCINVD